MPPKHGMIGWNDVAAWQAGFLQKQVVLIGSSEVRLQLFLTVVEESVAWPCLRVNLQVGFSGSLRLCVGCSFGFNDFVNGRRHFHRPVELPFGGGFVGPRPFADHLCGFLGFYPPVALGVVVEQGLDLFLRPVAGFAVVDLSATLVDHVTLNQPGVFFEDIGRAEGDGFTLRGDNVLRGRHGFTQTLGQLLTVFTQSGAQAVGCDKSDEREHECGEGRSRGGNAGMVALRRTA